MILTKCAFNTQKINTHLIHTNKYAFNTLPCQSQKAFIMVFNRKFYCRDTDVSRPRAPVTDTPETFLNIMTILCTEESKVGPLASIITRDLNLSDAIDAHLYPGHISADAEKSFLNIFDPSEFGL